jgi:8-oxo-dGTP pyrophosphatase MutT (NUDIX family)
MVISLAQLRPAVQEAWGVDTCDPHDLADWRQENPARGQCGPTALVVQDLLGGDLVLGEVHEKGARHGAHYWNRLPDGAEVDLTADQFGPGETVTPGIVVARPAGPPRRCRGQYELLRRRALTALDAPRPAPAPTPAGPLIRIALTLLIDPADAVLLNLRGEDAGAEPGQWALPGGHVQDGEDVEQAARRELAEETGLTVGGGLDLFWQATRPDMTGGSSAVEVHVFSGRCASISSDAIVVGEGQAARFVPLTALSAVDLSPTAAVVLARFMADHPLCASNAMTTKAGAAGVGP